LLRVQLLQWAAMCPRNTSKHASSITSRMPRNVSRLAIALAENAVETRLERRKTRVKLSPIHGLLVSSKLFARGLS